MSHRFFIWRLGHHISLEEVQGLKKRCSLKNRKVNLNLNLKYMGHSNSLLINELIFLGYIQVLISCMRDRVCGTYFNFLLRRHTSLVLSYSLIIISYFPVVFHANFA